MKVHMFALGKKIKEVFIELKLWIIMVRHYLGNLQ